MFSYNVLEPLLVKQTAYSARDCCVGVQEVIVRKVSFCCTSARPQTDCKPLAVRILTGYEPKQDEIEVLNRLEVKSDIQGTP